MLHLFLTTQTFNTHIHIQFWGERLSNTSSTTNTFVYEPFFPSLLSKGSDSAYPFDRTRAFLPSNLNFVWTSSEDDEILQDAIRQSERQLTQVAISDSAEVANAPVYGNYAVFGAPVERLYGPNLPRLKAIKAKYDPENVMGLAGGWKI